MAEQSKFLQEVDEFYLDKDAVEVFVNGDESTDVNTRLGATYSTLQKALKEMFENGGLPATPFRRKSDMESSALDEGSYAIVTDSIPEVNGLYVKESSGWVKSKYNPINNALKIANAFLQANDANVNVDTASNTITITGRVTVNKKTYLLTDKSVSYDPDMTAHALLAYNVKSDSLQIVYGADLDGITDEVHVFASLYIRFGKVVINGIDGYYIDDQYFNGFEYNTNSLVISNTDAIHFDFQNDRVVLDRVIWIPFKNYRIYIQPQTINLPTNRNKGIHSVAVYNNVADSVSIRPASTTYSLSVDEVVIFGFKESESLIYGLDTYTINGEAVTRNSSKSSALHLALFEKGSLNIDFNQQKLILTDSMWLPTAGERVIIPPQEVDFAEDWLPNSSSKHLITANLKDKTLSINRNLGDYKIPDGSVLIGATHDRHSTVWGLEGVKINGQYPDNSANPTLSFGFPLDNFINLDVVDSFIVGQDAPNLEVIRSWTVYGWYDALVEQYPDYVSKRNLGKDASGTIDIFEYIFSPPRYNNKSGYPANIPRIMIQCLHNEQINFVYPYIVMREICQNWQNHEGLAGLRWGAEIRVIPALNPWGLDNGSRTNSNGVDINRNYPYGWELKTDVPDVNSGPSPLSENEAKVSYQEMLDFEPHIMIDCHSFGGFKSDGRSIWIPALSDNDLEPINDTVTAIFANYKKKYDWLEPLSGLAKVSNDRINMGNAADARHSLGMRGGTLEVAWNLRGNAEAEVKGNNVAVNFAADTLLHFMRRCIAKLVR